MQYEKTFGAVVGVSVVDVRTGANILSVRAAEKRTPASNQKILTGAFALARLGGDFEFTTVVYLIGDDVLVFGDGDPTLGDPVLARFSGKTIYDRLDAWSAAIARTLGPKLKGDILVCGNPDAALYRHKDWPARQRRRWYSAPVAGLNFNNNCFDVSFVLDRGEIRPLIEPQSYLIRTVVRLKRGKRHQWWADLNGDDSVLTLGGTVAAASEKPISVAADDPPMLLGRVLADRLRRAGVAFAGKVRTVAPGDVDRSGAKVIYTTKTPLATAMARANKRSLNMAAECIFLRAGDGTWAGSAGEMTRTLVKTYRLDEDSIVVRDGSGLSHGNRIAPSAMTGLLVEILNRPDSGVLLRSLAVSGTDGLLAGRMRQPTCRGRVLAKTGYIARACCLSGYVLADDGTPAMAFSILVNDFSGKGLRPAKRLQDKICRLLVDSLPARVTTRESPPRFPRQGP